MSFVFENVSKQFLNQNESTRNGLIWRYRQGSLSVLLANPDVERVRC